MPKTLLIANAPGDSNEDGYPFNELFDEVQHVMPGREFESRIKAAAALVLWGYIVTGKQIGRAHV